MSRETMTVLVNHYAYNVDKERYLAYCARVAYHYPSILEWLQSEGEKVDFPETDVLDKDGNKAGN